MMSEYGMGFWQCKMYARTFYDGQIREGLENPMNLVRFLMCDKEVIEV